MKVKHRLRHYVHPTKWLSFLILICFSLIIWIPIYMIVCGSFIGENEIVDYIGSALGTGDTYVDWPLVPIYPTLRAYVELLMDTPKFFHMFWNSVKQVVPAIMGQLLVGIPAAWALAKMKFPGRKLLFDLYIILMIMPFQVTMVSSYLVLDRVKLLDTHYAIIIPAIFSTFPIFIMVKFFRSIPDDLLESARIDGASNVVLFVKLGIPLGNSGVISALVLSFIEMWNAIEQPITFLRNKSFWPLSLYMNQIVSGKVGVSFIASLIMMSPALLIFLKGQGYLEQGIVASGIKE